MARSSTRAALSSGSVIGMMGILMKLRKVCAHGMMILSFFEVLTIMSFFKYFSGVQPSGPFRAAVDSDTSSHARPQHRHASPRVRA